MWGWSQISDSQQQVYSITEPQHAMNRPTICIVISSSLQHVAYTVPEVKASAVARPTVYARHVVYRSISLPSEQSKRLQWEQDQQFELCWNWLLCTPSEHSRHDGATWLLCTPSKHNRHDGDTCSRCYLYSTPRQKVNTTKRNNNKQPGRGASSLQPDYRTFGLASCSARADIHNSAS